MHAMRRLVVAAAAAVSLAAPGAASACRTIVAAGSIQAAVAQAQPCDWVLVPPGTYRETVVIATPDVHVRGLNRNTVVVDAAHASGVDGIWVQADGVTVENLTVRDVDGAAAIRWSARRWRGSYLTVFNTGTLGLRGLSAEPGSDGAWDHVYAGGFAEAGVTCTACGVTVAHALAERNRAGLSAVGPSARVTVQDSLLRANAFGVQLGAGTAAVVRRNRVEQNDRVGVDLAGTANGLVANNVVTSNRTFGIVSHDGSSNRITGNVVRGSRYDLALGGSGDCVERNRARTSLPDDLRAWRCGSTTAELADPLLTDLAARLAAAKRVVRAQPAPPAQPTLPRPCDGIPANALCVTSKKQAALESS
jgi:parallel beta-helix repeat protein